MRHLIHVNVILSEIGRHSCELGTSSFLASRVHVVQCHTLVCAADHTLVVHSEVPCRQALDLGSDFQTVRATVLRGRIVSPEKQLLESLKLNLDKAFGTQGQPALQSSLALSMLELLLSNESRHCKIALQV